MAVYIFNLLVGYFPNGVDSAQGYRAKMLKKAAEPIKYIFTDPPVKRYVDRYKKLGIEIDHMLSVHQYFTDSRTFRAVAKTKDKLEELKKNSFYTDIRYLDNQIHLLKEGLIIAKILLEEENGDYFHCIHYYNRGKLVRTEHYIEHISYVEYYVTAKSDKGLYAKMVRRTFYNSDGAVVYNQIFEGKDEWYIFSDGRLYTKSQFIAEFVKRLDLKERDTVVLDRSGQFDFVQPLFQFGKRARFIAVLHTGHYFEKEEDPYRLYLNYEYYYWFKYSKRIDTMVVSTQEQKRELLEKLHEYKCDVPHVEVIPAGGMEYLRYPEVERKPYSLVTVSRLDKKKRVDWIIKSVIRAHQVNEKISMDIYGSGSIEETKKLQDMVFLNQAQSYIHFMGQMDVTEIYKQYEVYITASLGETLGLSLMEAVASGNAMIGLDVKYGNHLFIQPEVNGALVDFDNNCVNNDEKLIADMSKKIVNMFADKERLEKFHQSSYEIAKGFSTEIIQQKWIRLLTEKA